MIHAVFFVRAMLMLFTLPALLLLLATTAFASVGALTVTGLPPDTAVTLTGDDPKVKVESKTDKEGKVTFNLSGFNLPAGSKVQVTPAGGTGKVIPSLGDGPNTRDFRNPELGAYKAPGHGWNATARVSYQGRQTGQAESGVYVGPDNSIVESPKWVSGVSPNITLEGPLFGNWAFQAGITGFFGNGKNSETEPAGGSVVGITFDKSDLSNGINLGATGADTSSKVRVNEFEINLGFPNAFYEHKWDNFEFRFGPRLSKGHNWNKYDANFQSLTLSGISSTRDRDVKFTYGGPGITAQQTFRVSDQFELYAGAFLDAIYGGGKYDGKQHNLCNLCSPGLQDVTINTSDVKTGWSARPGISVGAEYEFNSLSLGANVGYEYFSNFLVLKDRPNPSASPPHLDGRGVSKFTAGAFLKFAW